MPTKKPAVPTDSAVGGRVITLRIAGGWLAVVVLGAVMGVGVVSNAMVATFAGVVLGLLLAAVVASVAIVVSGRVWFLFPAFLITCLYIAAVATTAIGYEAAHGTKFTATAVSSECHAVKAGQTCTARLRRPDGTLLDDALAVEHRMDVGETLDVIEDPAGIVAPHPADELDPDALPLDTILLGAATVLLAGLCALAAWLGIRRPRPPVRRRRAGRR